MYIEATVLNIVASIYIVETAVRDVKRAYLFLCLSVLRVSSLLWRMFWLRSNL